jgi:hypothetical protein
MKRLFKDGIVTTILGVLFMIAAGYLYIVAKDNEGAAACGGFGLLFLRTKDSLIGIKKND